MQTIALSLLIAAQTLLLQVNKTPNVTPELRSQVESVVQLALNVALQALNTPALSTPEVKPTKPTIIDSWKCYYDERGNEVACGG